MRRVTPTPEGARDRIRSAIRPNHRRSIHQALGVGLNRSTHLPPFPQESTLNGYALTHVLLGINSIAVDIRNELETQYAGLIVLDHKLTYDALGKYATIENRLRHKKPTELSTAMQGLRRQLESDTSQRVVDAHVTMALGGDIVNDFGDAYDPAQRQVLHSLVETVFTVQGIMYDKQFTASKQQTA